MCASSGGTRRRLAWGGWAPEGLAGAGATLERPSSREAPAAPPGASRPSSREGRSVRPARARAHPIAPSGLVVRRFRSGPTVPHAVPHHCGGRRPTTRRLERAACQRVPDVEGCRGIDGWSGAASTSSWSERSTKSGGTMDSQQERGERKWMQARPIARIVGAAVVGLLALTVLLGSFYTVDAGTMAVHTRFGSVVGGQRPRAPLQAAVVRRRDAHQRAHGDGGLALRGRTERRSPTRAWRRTATISSPP